MSPDQPLEDRESNHSERIVIILSQPALSTHDYAHRLAASDSAPNEWTDTPLFEFAAKERGVGQFLQELSRCISNSDTRFERQSS